MSPAYLNLTLNDLGLGEAYNEAKRRKGEKKERKNIVVHGRGRLNKVWVSLLLTRSNHIQLETRYVHRIKIYKLELHISKVRLLNFSKELGV